MAALARLSFLVTRHSHGCLGETFLPRNQAQQWLPLFYIRPDLILITTLDLTARPNRPVSLLEFMFHKRFIASSAFCTSFFASSLEIDRPSGNGSMPSVIMQLHHNIILWCCHMNTWVLFNDEIKMARKPAKEDIRRKRRNLGRWKGNIKEGSREAKTGTVMYTVEFRCD